MAGRPPEYKIEMCQELIDMMGAGMLDVEVYARWNISKNTFYRWLREHPELNEAHQLGLPKCEAVFVQKLRDMMSGDLQGKHSFTATIALLNNKFQWSKVNSNGDSPANINVNTINVFNTQDRAETLQFIKDQLLKQNIIDVTNDGHKLLESPKEPRNEE